MTSRKTLVASAALAAGMAAAAAGAETGDFDGDGRLTLRDVVLLMENALQPDFPFATGSFDAFAEYPPYGAGFRQTYIPASVYLESLRRTLSGPFPTFQIVQEPDTWLDEVEQAPLPSDGSVRVRLLPIETAGQPRVAVPLELTTTVPVRAFSLALESDGGMLRVPWVWLEQPLFNRQVWGAERWGWLQEGELRGDHDQGSFIVYVPPTGYLMSGGRYVIVYGTRLYAGATSTRDAVIPPGTHSIIAHGRLPKGTLPGTYPLRVLEGSQVLLEDGRLVAPVIEGEGEIAVTEEIITGWDEGLPPLRFDPVQRSVLGKVEFRLANSAGEAVPPDEPVASAMPGETMTFQVQVRTETRFYLGSNWSSHGPGATAWPDRPLEYFKPLGEWVGLYEVVMAVPEDALPQVIPLEFMEEPGPFFGVNAGAEFAPYWALDPRTKEPLWHYEVSHTNSFLRIGSEGDPPGVRDPPEHGIRFELKDVAVPAGELVEVPVFASSEESLSRLLLVVEFDPELIKIEALKTWGWNPDTGLVTPFVVPRGKQVTFRSPDCPPLPDHCTVCLARVRSLAGGCPSG